MPEWKHDIPTRYFATYEALENAFRERVAGLVPLRSTKTRAPEVTMAGYSRDAGLGAGGPIEGPVLMVAGDTGGATALASDTLHR